MSAKKKDTQPPSFETSLENLEAIVAEMEKGQLPLEELITRYEEGTKLLSQCEVKLKEAETKIEILRSKSGEKPKFAKFDPAE